MKTPTKTAKATAAAAAAARRRREQAAAELLRKAGWRVEPPAAEDQRTT